MRSRYKAIDEGCYFITSSVVEMIPVFVNDKYFKILADAVDFCKKEKNLKVFHYVFLDNHFHMIVSGKALSQTISSLKRHTARELIKQFHLDRKIWLLTCLSNYKKDYKIESDYQVWQEGFHPQVIYSNKMLLQKIEYIRFNPVKRGLVNEPEHWRYSSACNLDEEGNEIIPLDEIIL
jgi:REP element-mobilizing transposase RayT